MQNDTAAWMLLLHRLAVAQVSFRVCLVELSWNGG